MGESQSVVERVNRLDRKCKNSGAAGTRCRIRPSDAVRSGAAASYHAEARRLTPLLAAVPPRWSDATTETPLLHLVRAACLWRDRLPRHDQMVCIRLCDRREHRWLLHGIRAAGLDIGVDHF